MMPHSEPPLTLSFANSPENSVFSLRSRGKPLLSRAISLCRALCTSATKESILRWPRPAFLSLRRILVNDAICLCTHENSPPANWIQMQSVLPAEICFRLDRKLSSEACRVGRMVDAATCQLCEVVSCRGTQLQSMRYAFSFLHSVSPPVRVAGAVDDDSRQTRRLSRWALMQAISRRLCSTAIDMLADVSQSSCEVLCRVLMFACRRSSQRACAIEVHHISSVGI